LNKSFNVCQGTIIDNSAFSIRRGGKSIDWDDYYNFISTIHEDIDFFFIPDVIDGTELENDLLVDDFMNNHYFTKGVPVWHVNESTDRLQRLIINFDFIAIGSAGDYSTLGSEKWERKMDKAMRVICDENGYPEVKIHMLRCLNPKIFTRFPFYSGDSTTIAQNHSVSNWRRMIENIEKYDSPKRYRFRTFYDTECLFSLNIPEIPRDHYLT